MNDFFWQLETSRPTYCKIYNDVMLIEELQNFK